jgi:hypothetical protein
MGLAIEHGVPFTLLTLMIRFDPLNASDLASAESASGRFLTFQWSLKPSPRPSDFEPLDVLLSHRFGSTMDVLTCVLNKYNSVILKNDAAGLMQQRSYRKEAVTNSKRKNDKRGKEGGT